MGGEKKNRIEWCGRTNAVVHDKCGASVGAILLLGREEAVPLGFPNV